MKSYTDLKQSQKLVEFLPIESADMYYRDWKRMTKDIRIAHVGSGEIDDLPCWSLAALLDILPKGKVLIDDVHSNKYKVIGYNLDTDYYDEPIDACVEMIEKLHEQKLL